MAYSNAQILAAVVSEWVRPAVSQIAAANIMRIPMLQSLQATIGSLGIVSGKYSLQSDIAPMVQPVVNSLITSILCQQFSNIPDENIPQMAHAVVENLMSQGAFSILEGLVTFDKDDIKELSELLEKNLPLENSEGYQVIH